MILEVTQWRSVLDFKFLDFKGDNRLDPEDVRAKMLDFLREDAPHIIGQSLQLSLRHVWCLMR